MEEKHTCKLCFRYFSNGRALGGHMRFHVVSAAAAATKSIVSDGSSSSTSSREFVATAGKKRMSYGLRENPKKRFGTVDPGLLSTVSCADAASFVIQDHESETEPTSHSAFRQRRSKLPTTESLSSVSDTTPEEEVALSLVMLSRDVWAKEKEVQNLDVCTDEGIGRRVEFAGKLRGAAATARQRSRFQCGICKKFFRSYQALGGHRASHKKTRGCAPRATATESTIQCASSSGAIVENKTVHECPVCFKVFNSGQALGGHKRSHLSTASTAMNVISQPPPPRLVMVCENSFDLNLPAPMDDHVELSTVSDVEFVAADLPSL